MKKRFKSLLSILILLTIIFNSNVAVLASVITDETESVITEEIIEEEKLEDSINDEWTEEDFKYSDVEVSLYIKGNAEKVNVKGKVVSGLSEIGSEKIKDNKHLVIPKELKDGTKLVGVGQGAFADLGITDLTLPENTENFLLQSGSFARNKLSEVSIPRGIIQIGAQAFYKNEITKVIIPSTAFYIGSQSFANNKLTEVVFPEKSEIPIQVDNFSFAYNELKTVKLPNGIEKISDFAFIMNTGNDEKSPSTKFDCGVVWLYSENPEDLANDRLKSIAKTGGAYSDFQRLIVEENNEKNIWKLEDFTYENTTITGLSESGIAKRKDNLNKLVLPDKNLNEEWITALSDTAPGGNGLFSSKEEIFEEIVLPTKLENIGKFTFQNNKLKSVILPTTLKSIGDAAFQQNSLSEIIIPDSVENLGNGVFASQVNERGEGVLSKVILSKNLKVIPTSTFISNKQNKNFKELEIPEGVEEIGNNAFSGAGLISLKLPSSLVKIGNNAFSLHLLNSLEIPEKVTEIGTRAFQQCKDDGCRTLENLKLNKNLKTIGNYAFQNAGLKEVELPRNLEKLSKNVFDNNIEVVKLYTENISHTTDKINFPESTNHIITLKSDTWKIEDFTYENSTITGLSENGIVKRKDNFNKLVLPDKAPNGEWITNLADAIPGENGLFSSREEVFEEVVLPIRLENIGKFTFQNNNFKAITLPDTLKSIGDAAFQQNTLEEIILPNSVEKLGNGVFASQVDGSGEGVLNKVVISKNLKVIPTSTFMSSKQNKNFKELDIPEGVEEIGNNAFSGAGLTSLKLPSSLSKIGNNAFSLHLLSSLEIPEKVTEIGTRAFQQCTDDGCRTLENLKLNKNLKTIGNYAFQNAGLKEVELPKSLEKLPKAVFDNNIEVVKIYTANIIHVTDVKNFPESASHKIIFDELAGTGWKMEDFKYEGNSITGYSEKGEAKRKSIQTLVLPSKTESGEVIEHISDNAFTIPQSELGSDRDGFVSPYGMKSLVLPFGLKTIGKEAFTYHNIEKLVDLPNTLTSIGESAFLSNKLKQVILPDSVVKLEKAVFATNYIENVKLPKNLKVIPEGAFSINRPLRSIELPESIEEIGDWAFNGCAFQKLELPSNLQKVGRGAFFYHQVTNLTIPGSLKVISPQAFECTPKVLNLSKIDINEGVKVIEANAFRFGRLSEVKLPNSLEKLDTTAFANHSGFENSGVVRLTTENKLHITDKVNFPESKTHKIVYLNEDAKKVTIVGGIGTITKDVEDSLADFELTRISGSSRYETAGKVSGEFESSDTVVLASGEKYTDELTASVLANELGAPILLTRKDSLPSITEEEINRLKATKIIIVGGEGTISKTVSDKLSNNYQVTRLGGPSRYETSVLVGEEVIKIAGNKNEAILVDGTNYPDAIAMTSVAVDKNIPILLTNPKELSNSTKVAIEDWDVKNVTIGGGNGSVSEKIENELKTDKTVTRIAGNNRYETAILVAKTIYASPNHIVLTSGQVYPDAIVAAPYAAKNGYPIVFSRSSDIPEAVLKYINN